ncbi:MAG: HNH endonuclease [Chloroflexi bacterium]|nr:MAG: HNH endonuclease [Chloroflexota bacterium]
MKRKSPPDSKYPDNWREIAKAVKDAAQWKCVRCGKLHDPQNGYTLTVHHLDINPVNCAWWNIPPLCQRCHLSIQSKVVMDREWMFPHSEWFKPYVAAYYAVREGLLHPTTDYFESLKFVPREQVAKNLDKFLALGMPQTA